MSIIEIKGLTRDYEKGAGVRPVFSIEEGEVLLSGQWCGQNHNHKAHNGF